MSALEFMPIPSAPGYFATNSGEIVSLSGWRGREIKTVTQVLSGGKRYPAVRVMIDGKRVTKNVHALVAEAFYGPRPSALQVRHLDGNPMNNAVENLRYGTAKENCADREAHGRQARGASAVSAAKLTPEDVTAIRDRFARGETHHDLAKEFGVTPNHIHSIARRETWKHVA